ARWPKSSDGVAGLRRFADFSDRTAITLGIQLYRPRPRLVAPRQLVQLIVSTEGLTTKAYVPSP
ncbi:MAG TPA: hypothetical protein VG963_12535, partial [Polyangiaceae bacterium]|nr:hypothetical protein [Polyangiaceae bacterium]